MDLISTIPDFPTKSYSHILPALEKAKISVKDLVIFDPLEIAKQAKVPVTDVRNLAGNVIDALHRDLGLRGDQEVLDEESGDPDAVLREEGVAHKEYATQAPGLEQLSFISTLDPVLDAALAGGISTGYVTELAGESGSGKTQFLLHLLLSVQLPPPYGSGKKALYFSTESDLPTGRLSQLLEKHPILSQLPESTPRPSLENVLSITTIDLESQDHILNYQIPVAVSRYNVGLVVIDSITANYRAESDTDNVPGLLARAWQLKQLGQFLRNLAATKNIAIVVANQVSDQFRMDEALWADESEPPTSSYLEEYLPDQSSMPPSSHPDEPITDAADSVRSSPRHLELPSSPPIPPSSAAREDGVPPFDILDLYTLLKLDYQRPFFTGWGDSYTSTLDALFSNSQQGWKTPALGIVWTNQVSCRIVLKVEEVPHTVQNAEVHYQRPPSPLIPPSSPCDICNESSSLGNGRAIPNDAVHKGVEEQLACPNNEITGSNTPPGNSQHHKQPIKPESNHFPGPPPASANDSLPLPITYRKRRTIQVVFSPWTCGDPNQTLHHENAEIVEGGTVEYDPTVNEVEFEISPHGLRGINYIADE
ncbi:hypothetical protein FQN52_008808 [Onygenales sp. PD_12]|nr:hypothetical protein FQN52_008808 [Onygenales sp. PD_12]